jgi:hypothetical protein
MYGKDLLPHRIHRIQSTSSLQFFPSNFVLVIGPHFLWGDPKNKIDQPQFFESPLSLGGGQGKERARCQRRGGGQEVLTSFLQILLSCN